MLELSSNVSDVIPKVLKLSFEASECKPLGSGGGGSGGGGGGAGQLKGRFRRA